MIVAEKYSLRPNKLVIYNEISRNSKVEIVEELESIKEFESKLDSYQLDMFQKKYRNKIELLKNDYNRQLIVRKKLEKRFHQFKISINAYRNLKDKINWLYYLSNKRTVTTYKKKTIYNFKMCFLTLTLPSTQIHPTSQITKECLNQFFIELKSRIGLENYVWRLEFQKNKNVHYHIVSDSYIDYFLALKIWNRIIEKLGYVSNYKKKYENLSLYEYNKLTNKNNYTEFKTIAKRYYKGKNDNWNQPNSVDVKSVTNNKKISNYIAKYFGKNDSDNIICNDLDNENNSKSLRLWFCSRKLSKLKSVTDYTENCRKEIKIIIEKFAKIKIVLHKYCKVIYYTFEEKNYRIKRIINKYLKEYALELGYKSG